MKNSDVLISRETSIEKEKSVSETHIALEIIAIFSANSSGIKV